MAIGLLTAFGSWYEEQSAENIWGSMIIQVMGITAYFIGKLISQSKASFIIKWLNIIIALFMPVSLIVTWIVKRVITPYPTDIFSGIVFAIAYAIIIASSFFALKKYKVIFEGSGLDIGATRINFKDKSIWFWMALPIIMDAIAIGTSKLLLPEYIDHVLTRTEAFVSFDKVLILIIQLAFLAIGEEIAWRAFFQKQLNKARGI